MRASPFRGALVPAAVVAGDADATSIETNPGQLGLLDGASLGLVIDQWAQRTPRAGRGTALLLGTPLFGGLALGAGFQWLRPTLPGEPERYRKSQLGLGLKLSRSFGIGFSWEHLFGAQYAGRNALTLGFGARLHPVLAVGLAVRDVGRPRAVASESPLPREWEGELALRPFGNDRLELAIAGRLQHRKVRPRARASSRIGRGISLFAEVDSAHDDRDRVEPTNELTPARVRWSALAGLDIAFGRLGVAGAGIANWGQAGDDETPGGGASFVVRTLPMRRAPVIPVRHIERVKLEGLEDDGSFVQMVVRLRRLADDVTAGAVLLEIDDLDLGIARLEELRGLVEQLRRRKPVIAQVTQPSMGEYFLASACDRIVVHPAGALSVGGIAHSVTFYKNALDNLGVNVELVRIAEYKGAMEPFIMTEQSEPVRQNHTEVLDEGYRHLVDAIAQGRRGQGITAQQMPDIIEHAVFSASEAEKQKLVDAVADEKDGERIIAKTLGHHWSVDDHADGPIGPRVWAPSRVGVVLVDGAIVDGPEHGLPFSSGGLAFADRIIDSINQLRDDHGVRAVVLRVNSPGGSALASDRIARAVVRLRASGKPVVVSMGDVAASGGYYVAAPANEIFASPTTTTGSIGIFAYKVDLRTLLDKVGIGSETYKRGEHADLFSPYRPWSDDERALVERQIRSMYQLFLDTIANGRKDRGITAERANELGRGRIYTGTQALAVKLVDRLGGLSDAIDEAARRGHVERGAGGLPELTILPRPVASPLAALMRLQSASAAMPMLGPVLDRTARAAARMLAPVLLGPGHGIEARMPYDLELR